MKESNAAKELPACPVETTLMLIGDKWKVLILRDLLPGTKRFGDRQRIPKGAHRAAARYGKKRACATQGICRSAAARRIFAHRIGEKPEAHSGFHAELGRRI